MTKKELIENICSINGKLNPAFLVNLPYDELKEYFCCLEKQDVTCRHNTENTFTDTLIEVG